MHMARDLTLFFLFALYFHDAALSPSFRDLCHLQMHPKSAKPYEVEWRPYDSTGCNIALNPKKRIALTPRLFVGKPEDFEHAAEGDPPAGTALRGEFKTTTKRHVLTVPPIGSWCIVKESQPWGNLGPFAF